MKKQEILKEIKTSIQSTMEKGLGIEITDCGDDWVKGKMPVHHATKQIYGSLHGGASAAFAETLGSVGGNLAVDFPREYCVGVELNISHLRPVQSGFVYGKAAAVKIGRHLHVWQIQIHDEEDKQISEARLTVMVMQKEA
jgi:1,4-dihydroxy-2-naphthoyl-CoA hydrolase